MLRGELKEKGVFLLNLMSSPGSGKTTTLIKAINLLKNDIRIAVMEAYIDSDVDAKKIKEATGTETNQLCLVSLSRLPKQLQQPFVAKPSRIPTDQLGNHSSLNRVGYYSSCQVSCDEACAPLTSISFISISFPSSSSSFFTAQFQQSSRR